MQTEKIKQIKGRLDLIENSLKTFVLDEHKGEHFGPENEYTAESLKAGLKAILSDVRALTGAHVEFVRLSTYQERCDIESFLNQINSSLTEENYPGVVTNLDGLKSIVRQYNFRVSSESEEILKGRINNLQGKCARLEENLEEMERIGARAQKSEESMQSAKSCYDAFVETQQALEEKSNQINNLHVQGQGHSQEIADLLEQAKSHEGDLNHLADLVKNGETQLDDQQQKINQYESRMAEQEKQAEEITNRAAKALRDAAAASMSSAIHERYEEEKNKEWLNLLWLLGSAAFALIAMWLGYKVADQESITLGAVVARITIMSVAISGAWFCASQYVRYRNTVDDYGYKSVLARSIVAFLDQFKDPDERAAYLETVLGQIHQDPMRKKHDVDTPTTDLLHNLRGLKSRKHTQGAKDAASGE